MTGFVGIAFCLTVVSSTTDRPNVLYIVSDDLCCRMSCYGDPVVKTPNLDGLVKKGVRFDRAYCQFPLCNPSRASFLTGLRPNTTRVHENATQFRKNVPNAQSLPQTFRKAGYYVARVGKLYHYGVPLQIGTDGLDDPPSWQEVVNPKGIDRDQLNEVFSLKKGQFGGTVSWWGPDSQEVDHTDGKIADAVIGLLEKHKSESFFLACGFFRPHTPYVAPKSYFERYPPNGLALPSVPDGHRKAGPRLAFASFHKEQDDMSDDLRRQALQAYYASTTFMDAQVGKVLAALERLGLAKNTIVVFHSDHGYHLGEHGLWQKMSLFENSARVPMIVYDPRAKGNGKTSPRTVELIDMHATLADRAGLGVPAGLDGVSLGKLLDDPNAKWDRPALTQVTRNAAAGGGKGKAEGGKKKGGGRQVMGYSLRTERYRYTEYDGGALGAQLFDYDTDPQELKNLANDPTAAEVRKSLAEKLHAMTASSNGK